MKTRKVMPISGHTGFLGACALVPLCLLTATRPTAAQCGLVVSERIGGNVTAVGLVNSSVALVGQGTSLYLLNVANPASPQGLVLRNSRLSLDAPATKISMSADGTRAYVLEANGEFQVVGLSSFGFNGPFPNFLTLVGTNNYSIGFGAFSDILADGSRMYAVDNFFSSSTIELYDPAISLSNPISSVSPFATGYAFDKITRVGNAIWAAFDSTTAATSGFFGMSGYDFTDPLHPVSVATSLNVPASNATPRTGSITPVGNRIFVASANTGAHGWIRAFDVTAPSSPTWLPATDIGAINFSAGLSSIGNQLHIGFEPSALTIWDATNPSSPSTLGSLGIAGGTPTQIASAAGSDYIAAGRAGLVIVNTTNPGSMSQRSSIVPDPVNAALVRQNGNITVVADNSSHLLRLFDYTTGAAQLVHGTSDYGSPASLMELSVQTGGVYACVASGVVIRIIDITNPDSPILRSTLTMSSGVHLMSAFGSRLNVFDSGSRLSIIDLSNPLSPVTRTTGYGAGNYTSLASWSNTVALGSETFGLWLIDTTNAASPLVRAVWSPLTGYSVSGIVKGPTNLYVSARSTTGANNSYYYFLDTLNVSNPTTPSLVFRSDAYGPVTGLTYVSNATNKFLVGAWQEFSQQYARAIVFDVNNPALPVEILIPTLWDMHGNVAPTTDGTQFFVPNDDAGLYLINAPTQWAPAFVRQPQNTSTCLGGSATFTLGSPTVSANPAAVTYQWYRASNTSITLLTDGPTGWGSTITGSTTPTLHITSARARDASPYYFCAATNSCDTTNTAYAALKVCVADFDCSGAVTVSDIFKFLTAWFAGSQLADINGVGGVNVQDIFVFLGAWFAGC